MSDGHVLLEGVPGLAKTLAIKTLSQLIDAGYSRIQFTPDLLPADVIGTMIYSQKDEKFQVKKGPVFANFVLADEINRAPAKVQSALLEAMQEKQVTIGSETFRLPSPFLVMATQNPIEQEGTYPLPEAQVDRFMLKVVIDYPSLEEEKKIIRENIVGEMPTVTPVTTAYRLRYPLSRSLWLEGIERDDLFRWFATCQHQSCKSFTCLCIYQTSWLCGSRGCACCGSRCTAPSYRTYLRG